MHLDIEYLVGTCSNYLNHIFIPVPILVPMDSEPESYIFLLCYLNKCMGADVTFVTLNLNFLKGRMLIEEALDILV